MKDHYIVAADHGHLRIYFERKSPGQSSPALDPVAALDFPAGRRDYTDRETDAAGRFAGSGHPGANGGNPAGRMGMSIDERLPMQREEARRREKELAEAIEDFFRSRPGDTWDFAAGPELNGAVLERLSPAFRRRLRRSLTKDLVNQRASELRAHFAGVGPE